MSKTSNLHMRDRRVCGSCCGAACTGVQCMWTARNWQVCRIASVWVQGVQSAHQGLAEQEHCKQLDA